MITFKNNLSKKEEAQVRSILVELVDVHGDFYLTKNNLRLMIKDNIDVLIECLKKGDKIAFDESGVAIVTGYSDSSPRKYVKILTKELKYVDSLLKIIYWNVKDELYIKVKQNNPLKEQLLKCGFKFVGGRGKEVLLKREPFHDKEIRSKEGITK